MPNFNSFKSYLRYVSVDGARLLSDFEDPPVFELWRNPVLEGSAKYDSFSCDSGQSLLANYIFDACGGGLLVDDGHSLIDAGISNERRLWLIYRFYSLTDLAGDNNYTTLTAMLSVKTGPGVVNLWYGFDWSGNETLSRLSFDCSDSEVAANVLSDQNWRAIHCFNREYAG